MKWLVYVYIISYWVKIITNWLWSGHSSPCCDRRFLVTRNTKLSLIDYSLVACTVWVLILVIFSCLSSGGSTRIDTRLSILSSQRVAPLVEHHPILSWHTWMKQCVFVLYVYNQLNCPLSSCIWFNHHSTIHWNNWLSMSRYQTPSILCELVQV